MNDTAWIERLAGQAGRQTSGNDHRYTKMNQAGLSGKLVCINAEGIALHKLFIGCVWFVRRSEKAVRYKVMCMCLL
jgi:hypothetical protein